MSPEECKALVDKSLVGYQHAKDTALQDFRKVLDEAPEELDPGAMSSKDLGAYYDRCGQWHEHLLRVTAENAVVRTSLRKQLALVSAYLTTHVFASAKEKERSDLITTHPDFLCYDTALVYWDFLQALLEAQLDGMSRRLARISRHITLKQVQQPIGDRRDNVLSARTGYGTPAGLQRPPKPTG